MDDWERLEEIRRASEARSRRVLDAARLHTARVAILNMLSRRELTTGELAARLGGSLARARYHLGVLQVACLVGHDGAPDPRWRIV